MMNHWQNLQKPKGLVWNEASLTDIFGQFTCEPLEKGYGMTLGNSLRRVLLSSLVGAAITRIRIAGVSHEFTAIPGIKEDGTQLTLNVKGIVVKLDGPGPKLLHLKKDRPGPVTAGDIQTDDEVSIVNTDHYICTIDEGGELNMDLEVEVGRGYVPFSENRTEDMPLGVIPVDAIFSPIRKVKYNVENTRVSGQTDYEKLILELTTNGTISPQDAVIAASKIMQDHFGIFVGDTEFEESEESEQESAEARELKEKLGLKIDELELGVRALNCLYSAGINTVGDLVEHTEEEIMKVPHLGKKSLSEITEKLENLGLTLKTEE